MQETQDPVREAADAVCDVFRKVGDYSYAIFPKNLAHALGDLNKALLNQVKCVVDWQIQWTEDRVAGGDRLREEWCERFCRETRADAPTGPAS